MFDVFYSGVKPNQFAHEREADSIEHAQTMSRTRYFWWISYLCDYSDWDWLWALGWVKSDELWNGSSPSAGVGSAGFLTGEMLKQLAQVDMVHIPYKGSGPAFNDLLGGQTDAMFNALISSAPHIRSGRVRALAITAAARDAEFTQVPTLSEAVPGAVGDAWFGLSVPAKTPPAVVERLHLEMDKLLKTPEVKARLTELGMVALNLGPRGFQAFLQAENKKWAPIIRAAHIKIE
jgi:tripartite-type tricarboxylate transporter receptor subunit TctC